MYAKRLVNLEVETYVKRKCDEIEGASALTPTTDGGEDEAMIPNSMGKLSSCSNDATAMAPIAMPSELHSKPVNVKPIKCSKSSLASSPIREIISCKYWTRSNMHSIRHPPSKAFHIQTLELILDSSESVFGKEDASMAGAKRSAVCSIMPGVILDV